MNQYLAKSGKRGSTLARELVAFQIRSVIDHEEWHRSYKVIKTSEKRGLGGLLDNVLKQRWRRCRKKLISI